MSDRKQIILLCPSGFIIRNLILGKLPRYLHQTYEVTYAFPEAFREQVEHLLAPEYQTQFEDYPSFVSLQHMTRFWKRNHLHTLLYFTLVHQRSRTDYLRNSIRTQYLAYRRKHTRMGKRYLDVFSFLARIVVLLGMAPLIYRVFTRSARRSDTYAYWKDFFNRRQGYDLVVSTHLSLATITEQSPDFYALLAAHDTGIRTSTIIQSWDNPMLKMGLMPESIDAIWPWSTFMRDMILKVAPPRIKQKMRTPIGAFQFEYHRDEQIRKPRAEYLQERGVKTERYVLLAWHIIKLEYELVVLKNLVQNILERYPDYTVILRRHPKENSRHWDKYMGRFTDGRLIVRKLTAKGMHYDRNYTDRPEDFYSGLVNDIYHSDLVINASSSITVDAAIVDKPIVNIAYDMDLEGNVTKNRLYRMCHEGHFQPLRDTGGAIIADTPEECLAGIATYRQDPDYLREERAQIVELVTNNHIGNTSRVFYEDLNRLLGIRESRPQPQESRL